MIVATVWGPPGLGKINGRYTISRGKLIKSLDYRTWCGRARAAIRKAAEGRYLTGPVHVEIAVYWPAQHRTGPAAGLALGDVDALAKAALDSLQASGVIEDDAQVTRCLLTKHLAENTTQARVSIVAQEAP